MNTIEPPTARPMKTLGSATLMGNEASAAVSPPIWAMIDSP